MRREMNTAAIIIARGGSKRLPRKNVLPFCGRPLVAWTIVQSVCSHLIDAVYLSTDDDEIEEIGLRYGATVIRRPDWPDADQASGSRPIIHAMEFIEKERGAFKTICSFLPTSPLKFPHDIDRVIALHQKLGSRVVAAAQRRETFLYRRVHPIIVRNVIMDKRKLHYEIHGGIVVQTWGSYKLFCKPAGIDSDHDSAIDDLMFENPWSSDKDFKFVAVQPFQLWEVDTLEEFEVAELLMEKFILKGRGIDIYEAYKRAAEAEIEVKDER